jgi:hypothetical protein
MRKFLVAMLVFATLAFSQGNTARIDGVVTDPTGAAVPGAEIQVSNPTTGQGFKTVSNERGEWAIPGLTAAAYKVTVTKTGFKVGTVDGVVLNSGVPATVNLKLELGQATEIVEVSAGAEIVQAASSSSNCRLRRATR